MGQIRIATWNVNSVRKRIGLIARFAKEASPDVICLQETKCCDAEFPVKDVKAMGFEHVAIKGQKGYHGVAVLSKIPLINTQAIDFIGCGDQRHISVEVAGDAAKKLILHNFYVPAGGDEPDPDVNDKFRDKLAYLDAMARWGAGLRRDKSARLLAMGDLNVAPLETDVWSHKQLLKVVSHTPIEVELFEKARAAGGWEDVMRRFVPADEKLYTWWSYRAKDWRKGNRGRRLDHMWASEALTPDVIGIETPSDIRSWEGPSDHIPVIIDIEN